MTDLVDKIKEHIKYEEIEVSEEQIKSSALISSLERLNARLNEENERLLEENKRLRKELESNPPAKLFNTSTTHEAIGYQLPSEFRARIERDLRKMNQVKK